MGGRVEGRFRNHSMQMSACCAANRENSSAKNACTKAQRESSLEPKSPYSAYDCSPHLKSCKRNPVPFTELLSLSTQNQVLLRVICKGRARVCGPKGPQIPTDIRTCLPYTPWLLWECGAQGTASSSAGDLVLFSLHRFYPCVELRLINANVRKGKSWPCVGQSDRKRSKGLARAWLLMYSLRAWTKGVNRQLLLLHNCEC